jgi:hypothetical protein
MNRASARKSRKSLLRDLWDLSKILLAVKSRSPIYLGPCLASIDLDAQGVV